MRMSFDLSFGLGFDLGFGLRYFRKCSSIVYSS